MENIFNNVTKQPDYSKIPARVDCVNIAGLQRTKDDYVTNAANRLFKITNFQDLLLECYLTKCYLSELGVFKTIDIRIDISRGSKSTPNGYAVTFTNTEISRLVGNLGTEVGQNEGCFTTGLMYSNLFGRGESLSVNGSYSTTKTSDIAFKFLKTFYHTKFYNNKPEISITFSRSLSQLDLSYLKTHNIGSVFEFSLLSLYPFEIRHSFQYETMIHTISRLKEKIPMEFRHHCGPKLVSLIRHTMLLDNRDSSIFPTQGIYLKLTNEYGGGFGGNVRYLSHHAHFEYNKSLICGFIGQICGRVGKIKSTGEKYDLPISNLFYFGGTETLRGFNYGGAGPEIDGMRFGANNYWSVGCHLWAPLPFSSTFKSFESNLRTHMFYNFGQCNNESIKSSIGFGIACKLAERARIELNYCLPHKFKRSDDIRQGLQFNIGYDFI